MFPYELEISKDKIDEKTISKSKIFFASIFNFINQHNGIRPNKMHLLIAPTHAGKSTLVNSLICSTIDHNPKKKILLLLTEETIEDFYDSISGFYSNFDLINKNLRVMVEDKDASDDEIKQTIEQAIMMYGFDLIFVDNLTTSKLYMDRTIKQQSEISIWLKSLLRKTTLFIIAHTNGNNYNKEMLDETHIRGSKTITNIAEFLYILQPIKINNKLLQFMRIIKHRGQSPKDKFYFLNYDANKNTIINDRPVSFDDFKKAFKLRNKI